MTFVTVAPMIRVGNEFEWYLVNRLHMAQKCGLWCCPTCGIIGRVAHRYMSKSPPGEGGNEGACNPDYIDLLKNLKGHVNGDGI